MRRTLKEEERIKALEAKLTEEMRRQAEHVKRIQDILKAHHVTYFQKGNKDQNTVIRFIQVCVMPRVTFSEVDAVYCAKLVELLQQMKTDKFQTMVLIDRVRRARRREWAFPQKRHPLGRIFRLRLDRCLLISLGP